MMLKFDSKNQVVKGETVGPSYPNGGLRGTQEAGGCLAVETLSPVFLRGDTMFIPSVFVSYYGAALDEKTLLRANAARDKHGCRLLKRLGHDVSSGIVTNIGVEQEIFLILREQYYRRPYLQLTGLTRIAKNAPRGQETCDRNIAPLSSATAALPCMQEIQDECWRIGIPPDALYGSNTSQNDQCNVMVMQINEKVAAKHGPAALPQEKPLNDINGSGKHHNWSIAPKPGVNLLDAEYLPEATKNKHACPIVMAAVIANVGGDGYLMRAAIASPGNDFCLGAYGVGQAITNFLEDFMSGNDEPYNPGRKLLDLGTKEVIPFEVPAPGP
jgi:glutamine synthetase